MSITSRKPRPIPIRDKDSASLRDDRLFIVACDDTFAPQQYFAFLRLPRVQIHVVPTVNGTSVPKYVLERLLQFEHEEDDELWMLLDTDHLIKASHLPGLLQTLQTARAAGVRTALSRPCFELWLLLHFEDETTLGALANAKAVETALRTKLGEYNKTNLKKEHYPLPLVSGATKKARKLDSTVAGGDVPQANTSRVYQLLESIVAKALPSQVPHDLRELMNLNADRSN